jgi:hypothetical protein
VAGSGFRVARLWSGDFGGFGFCRKKALWKWFLRISKTKAKIELCVPRSISLWSILIVYIKTERTLIGLTPPRSNRA